MGQQLIQVDVVEDDIRALATQFLGDPFDAGGGVLGDQHTSAGGAGKGDQVKFRIGGNGGPHFGTGTVYQVEYAGWQT